MNILKNIGWVVAAGAFAFGATATPDAAQSAEFYKGKNLIMLIGTSPGGGYDRYGRLVGRHINRFLPGKPRVVPKNMPGAGSRSALNFLYGVAPQDGTYLGVMQRDAIFDPLFEGKKSLAKFDPTKFNWIGSANVETAIAVAWHTSPVKTYKDLYDKQLTVGATAPASILVWMPNMLSNMLGMKFRVIAGYNGGSEIDLAMQRGEVQGRAIYSWTSLKARRLKWLKDKKIRILFQMGVEKHPELQDVPNALDFAKNDEQRRILKLMFTVNSFGRPFMTGPKVPAARVKDLRTAFEATMKDAAFLKDAKKVRSDITPVKASTLDSLMAEAYKTPKALLNKIAALRKPKGKVQMRATNYRTVDGKISKIRAKGRRMMVMFKEKGKRVRAKVHGRMTKVTIGGKRAKGKAIKVGMTCKITYEGDNTFAKSIACR